jgi:peptide/nickel transport system permease protein
VIKPLGIKILQRAAFTALVLLVVWLILFSIRGLIPHNIVDQINEERISDRQGQPLSYDSSSWDWSVSIESGQPLSLMIAPRLGLTLRLIGMTALFSLVIAALLLYAGSLLYRVTKRPAWIAKLRSIIRSILVSSGVSITIFPASLFLIFFLTYKWSITPGSPILFFWLAFTASFLPAWLLVQQVRGELASKPTSTKSSFGELSVGLVTKLLKMIGVLVIVTVPVGLGSLLITSVLIKDFPVIFQIVWIFAVIVALTKLVAYIIEVIRDHFVGAPHPVVKEETMVLRSVMPKGWLIFSLVLCGVFVLIALFVPLISPYGYNETYVGDSLAPPSLSHLFGTDNVGRDIFSQVLYATRIDVLAGLACAFIIAAPTILCAMLSIRLQSATKFWGNAAKLLVLLPGEVGTVFPWFILLVLILSFTGPFAEIPMIALIISLAIFPRAIRMMQEAHSGLPEQKHGLLDLFKIFPILILFAIGASIIYSAMLGYFGLGVPPPFPEFGNMLTVGRRYILDAPWIVQITFMCLSVLLVVWLIAGDGLIERSGSCSKALWVKFVE